LKEEILPEFQTPMEALFTIDRLLLLQLDQSLGARDSHFNLGLVPLVVVSFPAIGSSISFFSLFLFYCNRA